MKSEKTQMASRREFLRRIAIACLVPYVSLIPTAQAAKFLKISVDTPANHVRNVALEMFTARLADENGELPSAEVFSSAQLAKDRDIVKALFWGLVDIGLPAISKMTRFDANMNLFSVSEEIGEDMRRPGVTYYLLIDEKPRFAM